MVLSKLSFENLSSYFNDEKEELTIDAINQGKELIYAGRIRTENLLGEPDLLRRCGNKYEAIDIKSGSGLEGASESFGAPVKTGGK